MMFGCTKQHENEKHQQSSFISTCSQGVAQEVQTLLNKYKKRISCVVYLNGIAYQWEFLSAFIACIALLVHQILKCSFDSVRRYV